MGVAGNLTVYMIPVSHNGHAFDQLELRQLFWYCMAALHSEELKNLWHHWQVCARQRLHHRPLSSLT